MRAVLAAGSKSPSHLNAALSRCGQALAALLAQCPEPLAAQQLLLQQAADFYVGLPQKVRLPTPPNHPHTSPLLPSPSLSQRQTTHPAFAAQPSRTHLFAVYPSPNVSPKVHVLRSQVLMVLDRLLALRLATAMAVATWATRHAIPATLGAPASSSGAWELLHYALDRSLARGAEQRERRDAVALERRDALERARGFATQVGAARMWVSGLQGWGGVGGGGATRWSAPGGLPRRWARRACGCQGFRVGEGWGAAARRAGARQGVCHAGGRGAHVGVRALGLGRGGGRRRDALERARRFATQVGAARMWVSGLF